MKSTSKLVLISIALLATALALNLVLFAFQFKANNAPYRAILGKVQAAFHYGTFVANEYPGYGPPFYHRALLGRVHYTECQYALVAIVDSDDTLRGAIVPKAVVPASEQRNKWSYCQNLNEYARNPASNQFKLEEKRSRYLWGGAAFMGNALKYMSVFQMKEFLKRATTLSIFLLSFVLVLIGRGVFVKLSPLIATTIVFSGSSFFSDIAFGLPFILSLLGPAFVGLAWLYSARLSPGFLSAYICGGLSTFIWMVDGHTLQFVVWIFFISYYALRSRGREFRTAAYLSFGSVCFYALGFTFTYVINQILKSFILGWGSVWGSLISRIRLRSSTSTFNEPHIHYGELLERLWHNGFELTAAIGHPLLADVVFVSSSLALTFGIAISIYIRFKGSGSSEEVYLNSIILGVFVFYLVRFFLTQNHSWILPHSHFVGRYIFILVGLCWVSLLASCIALLSHFKTR